MNGSMNDHIERDLKRAARQRGKAGWRRPLTLEHDWRLEDRDYRMSARFSAGMPDDMKIAFKAVAKKRNISMSELFRRLVTRGAL